MVSVVIPALNEENRIGVLIASLRSLTGDKEIIVADGGSSDRTVDVAASNGARVVRCPRGRGIQQREGAAAASGDVLWFLHADCRPAGDALRAMETALLDRRVVGGNFRLIFEGNGSAPRQMTWLYPKLRLLGLSYGDAGIFVRRSAYDEVGGFRPMPLFEDLDFVRRLKPMGRFAHLDCPIRASSRRFEGRNYGRAWATWITLQLLYWFGVSPNRLARWYRPAQ